MAQTPITDLAAALARIAELEAQVAEEQGWVEMLRDERDELLRQRNAALTRVESLQAERDHLAAELITSEAARKLAEERLAKAVEALSALDRAAGEVARQGAVTGPQWTRLNIALLKARAILKEIDNG